MTSPDMDAFFESSDDDGSDPMSRQLAAVGVFTPAVHKDPEHVLNPTCADLGIKDALGLTSHDQVDDGIIGYRFRWRFVTLKYALVAEDEHEAISNGDHRGDNSAHGFQWRALIQLRSVHGVMDCLDRVLDRSGDQCLAVGEVAVQSGASDARRFSDVGQGRRPVSSEHRGGGIQDSAPGAVANTGPRLYI